MFDNPSLLSSAILCRRNEESGSGDGWDSLFPTVLGWCTNNRKKDPATIIRGCGRRKQLLLLLTAAGEAERFRN